MSIRRSSGWVGVIGKRLPVTGSTSLPSNVLRQWPANSRAGVGPGNGDAGAARFLGNLGRYRFGMIEHQLWQKHLGSGPFEPQCLAADRPDAKPLGRLERRSDQAEPALFL